MLLLVAHLTGDFILQDHWMQRKTEDSFVCLIHVIFYSLPFLLLVYLQQLHGIAFFCIIVQHFLQDRYQLHRKWMRAYGQSTPEQWPLGPLCSDQAWHLLFIAIFTQIFKT